MSLAEPFEDTGKSQRIYVRVTPRQKSLIQKAAELKGLSISDYVLTIAERKAEEDIARVQIIELTTSDSAKLADLLLNPPEPSDNLKNAAMHYQNLTQ